MFRQLKAWRPLSSLTAGNLERSARPLLICDADEVLFKFVVRLEAYLETQGLRLDLTEFRLAGNIRRIDTDEPVSVVSLPRLLQSFFAAHVGDLEPVPGAAEALSRLSALSDIVVLSNVPGQHVEARRRSLARHGMPYDVISNRGTKGAKVKKLAAARSGPVFFIDDLPNNLESVAEQAAHVHCIHFVYDPRLFAIAPRVPTARLTTQDWAEVVSLIEEVCREAGEPSEPAARLTG